jgi:cytochrome b pre-mRNA-processing protein 3
MASPAQPATPNLAGGLPKVISDSPKLKISLSNKFTTYTAYGITEILYKECGSKADYTIPKVSDDTEPSQTEEGEDLGVGESWWHTGRIPGDC